MIQRILRALACRRDGSVSVVTAVALPILIAVTGMVAEYGNGLLHKMEDQRVADAAAFAAATAYAASSSNSLTSVVDAVASANGVATSNISASLVSSPTADGNQAVLVNVSTQTPLLLSTVLGNSQASLNVTATSYAEIKSGAPGCIIALSSSGTGITVTSSAGITANSCAVDSNAGVLAQSSSNITTTQLGYDSSTAPQAISSSTIGPPAGKTIRITKQSTPDPLAGNSAVVAATSHLTSVESMTSPAAPSVASGNNVSLSASTLTGTLPSGCSASGSGVNRTITCTSGGTYNFGSVSASSTGHLTFALSGSSATTFNFSGGISATSSASVAFPNGTYNVAQGVTIASSSTGSFGAGSFDIGPSTSNCSDGFKYSLCVESSTSLSFGGPSSFTLSNGVYDGSSANLTLGAGTANSFDIGAGGSGYALQTSSSSNVVFGDATSGSTSFEVVGNIDAASSACVALPNADAHDINGAIIANSSSNTTFGGGVYTVSGYLLDQSSSGGGSCLGSTAGTGGSGVTFVLGAATTPSSGTCSGMAICVTSSSGLALSAPTSGTYAGLAVIGPTNGSTAGALFESSSSGSFSGAVYLPTGAISVSSSASLGGGSSACLMLIGSQISVTSSSALGSTCTGLGGASTGGSVVLVQ